MLVRIIQDKNEYQKKLRDLYGRVQEELNSGPPDGPVPEELRENLDRLKVRKKPIFYRKPLYYGF